jgi:hypothetical protein
MSPRHKKEKQQIINYDICSLFYLIFILWNGQYLERLGCLSPEEKGAGLAG